MESIKKLFLVGFVAVLSFYGCSNPSSVSRIKLNNPTNAAIKNGAVEIALKDLPSVVASSPITLSVDGKEIPYQLDDMNGDGTKDCLFFQVDLPPLGEQILTIARADSLLHFKQLTDAVLKIRDKADPASLQVGDDFEPVTSWEVPSDLKQDNGLIFLEGPAWESDLIGYRFYIDDRTRFDIFGKRTHDLSMSSISGNYHEVTDWGADILNVGASLGMGSPAIETGHSIRTIDKVSEKKVQIITTGPLRSIIRTTYKNSESPGNSIDVTMDLEIHAHHRYTKVRVTHSALGNDQHFVTGLVRHPNASDFEKVKTNQGFGVYSWGDQSYHNDPLGLALIVSDEYQPEGDPDNDLSYLVNLRSSMSHIEYYFLAAWGLEAEDTRVKNGSDFEKLVTGLTKQLSHPIEVTIMPK